ncbi:MAG TPA: hypothetical protein VGQ81_09065 [Acidobacteriota bacterium]|nr:hypothetical protein [Acidobacteriota bacterium]
MARQLTGDGNNNLQQAMALLINNQAAFVAQLNETNKRQAAIERKLEKLDLIEAILLRHDQVLADLPEAIRQKVGFKNR